MFTLRMTMFRADLFTSKAIFTSLLTEIIIIKEKSDFMLTEIESGALMTTWQLRLQV